MGCAESNLAELPQKIDTRVGVLEIRIDSIHIDHLTSSASNMDPFIILKLSNQQFQTQIKHNGGRDVEFDQSFIFHINSCYKMLGRTLELEVWDKNRIGQSEIGFGISDMNILIDSEK